LVETYVRVKRARGTESEVKKEVKPKVEEEMYTFEEDEGGWQEEENDQAVEQEEAASPRNRTKLPLKGPSTNAGFPADSPPTTRAGLASAQAEEETLKETLVQQVDAMEGYEVVPEAELDAMLDNPDEESGLELLLTGTGHSAWGSFILRGRVRAWDGMASLVKEYSVSKDENRADDSPTPAGSGYTEGISSLVIRWWGDGGTRSRQRSMLGTRARSSYRVDRSTV
jgi:hypothetical protein